MHTRPDIDAELERLQQRLPMLVEQLPADQVLAAFAREAGPLTESVPEEHRAYVTGRLNCMLAAAGLVPGETEGEPCPTGD